eukprot:scaffold234271_cov21-Tisochrysis_lutea.AAC.2
MSTYDEHAIAHSACACSSASARTACPVHTLRAFMMSMLLLQRITDEANMLRVDTCNLASLLPIAAHQQGEDTRRWDPLQMQQHATLTLRAILCSVGRQVLHFQ